VTDELSTNEQAVEFLSEVAQAIFQTLQEDDPDGAVSVSTALVMVGAILQREIVMADQMAACMMGSIKDGKLREDEALTLLSIWKKAR